MFLLAVKLGMSYTVNIMNIATFDFEKELLRQGYGLVLGVDEAGRGPLAGPVVAAAVILKKYEILNPKSQTDQNDESANNQNKIQNTKMWDLVRDSKKLSENQREKVFDFIHENFYVGIGLCNHETIDRINILEASFLSMKKAAQELMRNTELIRTYNQESRTCILVDGNKQIPNFSYEQKVIIGGDGLSKSIAAASIIAKVTRDRIMMDAHEKYPVYGFDKHKGYGTKLHMDVLFEYGPCEIHRKSFAPVKKTLR